MTRTVELATLTPDELGTVVPVDDYASLVVLNGLSAPIYVRWGDSEADPTAPSATGWDWAVPGDALMIVPVPAGARRARLLVVYPGAPPGADVRAVIHGSECAWAPQVGPVA